MKREKTAYQGLAALFVTSLTTFKAAYLAVKCSAAATTTALGRTRHGGEITID